MSLRNNKHSIMNYNWSAYYETGFEEYQAKIDSLVELMENAFTQTDYELDFQLAYSKTHEICINRMGKELDISVKKMLKRILKSYNNTLIKLNDSAPTYEFFSTLIRLFNFFKTKVEQISDSLSYMERINVRYSQTGETIAKKGMRYFYHGIIFNTSVKDKIMTALNREITRLRTTNYQSSEKFISLFSIFLDKSYGLLFYSIDLIQTMINEAYIFYDNTCVLFVKEIEEAKDDKVQLYKLLNEMLRKVNSSMENELKLFKDFDEREGILRTIFDIMIKRNFELIRKKGMNKFFKRNDVEAFSILYAICFNYPMENNIEPALFFFSNFQEILDKRLKQIGDTFVIAKPNKPVEYLNFPRYIDEICELKKNCSQFLLSSFDHNPKLEYIIKTVFEKYINQSTAFLVHFVRLIHEEIKLCQKIRSNKSLADFFEKFPTVFKLISDKDLFEEEYRHALCKRLIRNASMIKETEFDLYAILKKESGVNYVKKIENMINDVFSSQDINMDFRIQLGKSKEKLPIDFYIKVLSQDNWPIDKEIMQKLLTSQSKREGNEGKGSEVYTSTLIVLPPSIDKSIQEFSQYYVAKFKNRFVTFVHELSWAEVRVKINHKAYLFIVSTFQLAILMLFNARPQLDRKTISASTKIPLEQLDKHCYSLMKLGILNEEKDCIALNDQFTSDAYKLNFNYFCKEKKDENKGADKEVNHMLIEDRKHQIDAAIIHQLKTNRKMKFDDLKNSIVDAVSNYFVPETAFIKARLDNLVERNFIEREELNPNVYVYIA